MALLGFGQPQTGIMQMAYVVADIDAAMRTWVDELKVGPWFRLPSFKGAWSRATAAARRSRTSRWPWPTPGT